MDTTPLAGLERALCAATDLSTVYTYFADHLLADPALLDDGTPTECPAMTKALAAIIHRSARRGATSFGIVAFGVDGTDFVHGVADWGDWMALVFVFERSRIGYVAAGPAASGPTLFARFRYASGPGGVTVNVS